MARRKKPSLETFSMVISPKGIRYPDTTLAQWLTSSWHKFVKVLYLVWFNLQKEAFGTTLGHVWLILEPMLQAFTYYLLIKFVFAIRGADMSFAFFYSAVTFWRSHAVMVSGGSLFFFSKGHHYIQQNLGIDIAYMEHFVYEFILFLIRFLVLAVFLVVAGYPFSFVWGMALVIGFIQFIFSMSLVVWLSIFGTFMRDLSKFVGHIVWFWWYMSPGLYSIGRIPDWARPVYELNPFAHLIPAMHQVLLKGELPSNGWALFTILVASSVILWAGWRTMSRVGYRLYRQV